MQAPKNKLALALLACEEEAERLRENGSIVTLVRLGAVIAPGGAFPEPLLNLLNKRFAWRKAHAEAAIPAIDHVDAVALFAWLVRSRPMAGAIHGVAPEPLPTPEVEKMLAQLSPKRMRIELPRWALRRQVGILADLVHSRHRVIPQRALDARFTFTRPDPLESLRAVLVQHVGESAPKAGSLLGAVLQRN